MTWSPQQDAALKAVADWLRRGDRPVFRLFGYAGTGKTTLAKHIAENVDGEVAFGAYTGKAALVLRTKGCTEASTIHSMIYRSRESDENGPQFVLNRQSPASKADLIIIDECSMVDEELGRDLLSFGQPVLVLGDPAQLPPVKGGGFFTDGEPDVMLTEVHRQAKDNPIIHLSMQVREGGRLEPGTYGESRIIRRREIDANVVMAADQVLVGLNKTRRLYNTRLRELNGYRDPMPAAGEKLVCLRNGTEEEVPFVLRKESDEFTYGYALTVHKAQGSQWDDLVLFDESYAFREHRSRWLYTALTRAAEKVTVVV